MRTLAAITSLLAYCATAVSATALTYQLEAHERACFFTDVKDKGTKVAFYFAVSDLSDAGTLFYLLANVLRMLLTCKTGSIRRLFRYRLLSSWPQRQGDS